MTLHGPDQLVDDLVARGAFADPAWETAMRAVRRHEFLPEVIWPRDLTDRRWRSPVPRDDPRWWEWAYSDYAIVTQVDDGRPAGPDGRGRYPTSSASQPSLVVAMLQALDVAEGHRVLEIGTGTGYNTALLCHRLGDENVTSIEVDETVAGQAAANLKAAGYAPRLVVGDGAEPVDGGPFDRVIATVAAKQIPGAWVGQTAPGGVIVTPWATPYYAVGMVRLVVGADGIAHGRIVGDAAFMLLRDQRAPAGGLWDFVDEQAAGVVEYRTGFDCSVLAKDDPGLDTMIGALVPGLAYHRFNAKDGSGEASVYVWDRAGSWGLIEYEPGAADYEAKRCGPRDLWAEVEAACEVWDRAGRPGRDRYGLTVTSSGEQWLWVDEPGNLFTP